MPLFGGMFAKKLLKASSPPAEAPRPTSNRGVRLPPWRGTGAVTSGAVDVAFFRVAGPPSPPRFPFLFRCAIEWPPLLARVSAFHQS
jgi:hypothetical protein